MRQRRTDRLLLRADIALDAGCADDARQALEELEVLSPHASGIAELRARLAQSIVERPLIPELELTPPVVQAHVQDNAEPRKKRASMSRLATALLLLSIGGWFVVLTRPAPTVTDVVSSPSSSSTAPSETPPQPQGTASPPVPASSPVQVSVEEVATNEAVAQPQPEPVTEQPPLPSGERKIASPPSTTDATTVRVENIAPPAPAPVEASPIAATPPAVPVATTLPLERTASEPLPSAPPAAAPPVTPPAVSSVAADTTPATPRSAVTDDVGVRMVLARYESAYSRLDVDAAGAVWPGLDRRRLARAFDGLASQRVDLGACDVRIAGETAVAECMGSATWTPKVGGGSHNQRRRWQFRLRNASGSWQIVGATVK